MKNLDKHDYIFIARVFIVNSILIAFSIAMMNELIL